MKEALAIIAVFLAIGGNLPYLWDLFKGRVKPHPYTWFVWTLVLCIVFFGQLAKGAGVGALPTGASGVFAIIIFLFSLKYGFKGITKTDTLFLGAALVGVGIWMKTHDPTIAIIIAVSIDLAAFIPTLRKTWVHPATETPILYSSNVLRHILVLFSLQAYNVATVLHSVVMITVNTLMALIILLRKEK